MTRNPPTASSSAYNRPLRNQPNKLVKSMT